MNSDAEKNISTNKFDVLFKDEFAVILLQGKNSLGEEIFSYLRVTLPNIKKLYAALHSGADFSPSEFGTVVAEGKGAPSDVLRAEMAAANNMLEEISPAIFPPRKSIADEIDAAGNQSESAPPTRSPRNKRFIE